MAIVSSLIIANWKMNKTIAETKQFVHALTKLSWPASHQAVICGPFTTLTTLQQLLIDTTISYGAQNMHWENTGAFTGEISANMLAELGCRYVIIGHSERRRDNNETDLLIQKKVAAALQAKLTPIICVGETLAQRTTNQTIAVIEQQVTAAVQKLTPAQLADVVIAYEPVWAIGTGQSATIAQAQAAHACIRALVSVDTPIIYGGSVNSKNIAELLKQPDINGVLVGGASLQVDTFIPLLR